MTVKRGTICLIGFLLEFRTLRPKNIHMMDDYYQIGKIFTYWLLKILTFIQSSSFLPFFVTILEYSLEIEDIFVLFLYMNILVFKNDFMLLENAINMILASHECLLLQVKRKLFSALAFKMLHVLKE